MPRPINADVPPANAAGTAAKHSGEAAPPERRPTAAPAARQPTAPRQRERTPAADRQREETAPRRQDRKPQRRRRAVPAALKGIGGLVVLAIVFIVAAILGGGSTEQPAPDSPAPVRVAGNDGSAPPVQADEPSAEGPNELGYPAFATSNTTRVGGPDPVANAAGVALAVYPSEDDAQRPPAVVLVDGEDWQGGVAAAVLMAAPLGAPGLITEGEELPDPSAEALDALDPQGGPQSGGAAIFAIGPAASPDDRETRRIEADGAAATAAAIARLRESLLDRPPRHLVVAPVGTAAFAVPAAAWAARSGDPVLFAERERLPAATAKVLREHRDVPVYVLGPSSAISSSVVRQISAINKEVRRVSGEDPVENAIAFARYGDGAFGWNVNDPGHGFVVARSDSPLDAVAAAPLSASGTWGPLLLTDDADTLPAALRGYLLDVKPGYTTDPTRAFYNHVWVIGDEDAIDVSQQAEIDELAELAKIGGAP